MKLKAQAWGTDLMVASVIFTSAIVFFYFYALNDPNEAQESIDSMLYDGRIIADVILSEGYPKNWSSGDVVTIGILTNNKINETKLERFYDLAIFNYPRTKSLFNTKYNYYFNFSETMFIGAAPINGIGSKPLNQKNLVKISRFTVYKDKPMSAYLYIWE